jgi:hypothetical protein
MVDDSNHVLVIKKRTRDGKEDFLQKEPTRKENDKVYSK